jgi:hypothetical protein
MLVLGFLEKRSPRKRERQVNAVAVEARAACRGETIFLNVTDF